MEQESFAEIPFALQKWNWTAKCLALDSKGSTKQKDMIIIKLLSMYFFPYLVIAITALHTCKFPHTEEVQVGGSCQPFVLWKNISIRALVRLAQKGPCWIFKALYMTVRPGISRSTFLRGKLGELEGLNNSSVRTRSIYCSSRNCPWDKAKPRFSLSFLQEKNHAFLAPVCLLCCLFSPLGGCVFHCHS